MMQGMQQLRCLAWHSCAHLTALPALTAAPSRLASLRITHVPLHDDTLSASLRVKAQPAASSGWQRPCTSNAQRVDLIADPAWHVLQGAHELRHLDLRRTQVSAGPLRELTSLRSLAVDASALTQPPGHMDLLTVMCSLTRLQVWSSPCAAIMAVAPCRELDCGN